MQPCVSEWSLRQACLSVGEFTWISDAATNGRSGRGFGAGEQRTRALALAAFEIAIAGADGIVTGGYQVSIHAEAHRAAALAPFSAGVEEHLVQAFSLRGAFDCLGTGHHQHLHALRELVTA